MNNTETSQIIELASYFQELIRKQKDKAPYHINLIDELRANENAHSRIFIKLIQFEENGKYPFLELFLKFLGGEFSKIIVAEPIFTAEKDRIDALIKDDKGRYVIIIENKIHEAVDQEQQLERYLKIMLDKGFSENEIYVLYLTKKGGSPSEDSFSLDRRKCRYKEINFKDDILPLLKEQILPICRVKDELLISSIQQYIDHLNGLLNQRTIDYKMKEELTKQLLEKLNIDELNEYEKLSKVYDTIEEVQEVSSCLNEYCASQIKKAFFDWKSNIHQKFNKKEIVTNIEVLKNDKYFYLGIKLKYNNQEFSCSIGMDDYFTKPYYGITVRGCTIEEKDSKIESFVQDNFKSDKFGTSPRWYGFRRSELSTIFTEYEMLCQKVIKLIDNQKI
ncbi:MAG: hypothetical protein GQ564_23450 [Bacteroidales bacterium]|nr:hypothetical protein [Bacteroidales bacterium]